MTEYKGVVGTPVTPLDAKGDLDKKGTEQLINFLVETGIDGLALPMHIGESLNLTMDERKELTTIAMSTVDGRIPVLINVSTPGTDAAEELARHADRAGASGVVLLSPYFWQPADEGVLEHYRRVGSAISGGLLAYNFPEKVGLSLEGALLQALFDEVENFVGIKDASFRMDYFTDVCRIGLENREGFAAFTGVEYMLPGMAVGGVGAFSALGAIAPRLVRELYEACLKGDENARELQYRLGRLWGRVKVGYPATIKAAMALMCAHTVCSGRLASSPCALISDPRGYSGVGAR
jgi:4-hydroxy-tetrahydrodipicolinate synthase